MARKKIDKRIRVLIENSIACRHRSLFIIYGEKAREQVVVLRHVFLKCRGVYNTTKKESILWCFKKEKDLNIYRQNKILKRMKKKYVGRSGTMCNEDIFEHFLISNDVQLCHYSETDRVLGQTFSMLVIQDFEALTPNILARVMECVEGGGIILFLLPQLNSLEELFLLQIDAHNKYVTEAQNVVSPRFNRRFVLSLVFCPNCLVLDDSLKIKLLPKDFNSDCTVILQQIPVMLHTSETSPLGMVQEICCTVDQSHALLKLSESLKNRNVLSVVSLTSGRGRGKSAVLGLAVSVALYSTCSNVFLTAPHLKNLQTFFSFLLKGLTLLGFVENTDFKLFRSETDLVRQVTLFQDHVRSVRYLSPVDVGRIGNADLVVIDEAAAIPLYIIKKWMGFCTVFMASTVNGYEGTGRSLSLKLVSQLRSQSLAEMKNNQLLEMGNTRGPILHEVELNEAIRYSNGDKIEEWLNHLLCLDAHVDNWVDCSPPPIEHCQLYYVNRDVLFGYHPFAEKFLQQIVSLFVSSHYKNSPNDLLMMADAPANQVFCLLPPDLRTILCAVQVTLEGKISTKAITTEQLQGRRPFGDLIPWLISQQYQDKDFPSKAGARVVRVATHPQFQKMGYGCHTLQLLSQFYAGSIKGDPVPSSVEINLNRSLLLPLKVLSQGPLDYLGVSYGLTSELYRFWKRAGFVPLYIRQTKSEVTGEHSCVMVKSLGSESSLWISDFFSDFVERFINLMSSSFCSIEASLALSIIHYENFQTFKDLSPEQLRWSLSKRSLQRISAYCLHQVDYHLILDVIPVLARLYFMGYLDGFFLSAAEVSVLVCIGLQNKSVEGVANEMSMDPQQVMSIFRKALQKILHRITHIDSRSMGKDTMNDHKWPTSMCNKRKRQNLATF